MTIRRARTFAAMSLVLLCSALLPGCATRGNLEVLEAQLRSQEALIRRYERDLDRLRGDLTVSQRELDLLRSDLASQGDKVIVEETSHSLAKVEGIVFNSLLTAPQDRDNITGDEGLHAVFYPHDAHGEIVKLSGRIEFEVIDLSRPANEKTIGHWEFTPDEARKLWYAGFLMSGYQLDLPWQQVPVGPKVLLLARLITPDGRKFEATHQISVRSPHSGGGEPEQIAKAPKGKQRGPEKNEGEPEAAERQGSPQSRRVPDPYELSVPAEPVPNAEAGTPAAGHSVVEERRPENPANAPRPFPVKLRTSDSWSEPEIPVLR